MLDGDALDGAWTKALPAVETVIVVMELAI